MIEELFDQMSKGNLLLIDMTYDMFNGMQTYIGDPPFKHEYFRKGNKYGEVTLSTVYMGLHSGTHIDLPLHFVPNGESVEKFNIIQFIGYGNVLDLSYKKLGEPISSNDLKKFDDKIKENYVVMLYTGFSATRGKEDFLYNWPYLDSNGADYLVSKKIRAVGIESMSIAGWAGKEYPPRTNWDEVVYVHHKLLSNDIIILESVNNMKKVLEECKNGEALFFYAPLKIVGAEGGPTRLFAICEKR
ncbi:cyclase family protein [Sulfolobus islandicus Y.G.57.14]|jgi:kynurenine formamidase|uniref:Cyclase family protein n=2 Tax=Saccharolobus islandicus TaxID=43080 RepID=C3NA78_SACI7|nr:cyclase family protein [Sulfolobus islandicus]ACP46671.1 cyclase family protein [Sulfolobus islandicus Y.G.57.14]ACP47635.1 cyclase family protein [Sulfolobus islandicus Y.N.15.51]